MLELTLRHQELGKDEGGHTIWKVVEETFQIEPEKTCLLLCDLWNDHWCRGAVDRLEPLIPQYDRVIRAARAKGIWIVHSPSEISEYYAGTPGRERMRSLALALPKVELPRLQERDFPPLPIDDSDDGCDTGPRAWRQAWSREHPGIFIDMERDGISEDETEIYSFVQQKGIEFILFMGIHTNMCVLNRPFGIKRWVRRGFPIAFVSDLTDAMYNPAMPPYVSHEEGTRLVVEYIEKFLCPTVTSDQLSRE